MKGLLLTSISIYLFLPNSFAQITGNKSIGNQRSMSFENTTVSIEKESPDSIKFNQKTYPIPLKLISIENQQGLFEYQTIRLNKEYRKDLDSHLVYIQNRYILLDSLLRDSFEKKEMNIDTFEVRKAKNKAQFDEDLAYYYQLIENRHADVYLYRINRNLSNNFWLTRSIHFFPALNSTSGRMFYDGIQGTNKPSYFGNSGLLVTTNENISTTMYTEIVKDYFGPIRVSLLTQLSTSAEERDTTFALADSVLKQNEAFQNLLASGGNVSLNINYPLLYIKPRGYGEINVMAGVISSFAIPKVGTSLEKPLFNLDMGFDYSLNLTAKNNLISFFLVGRSSALWSSQNIFYDQLERTGDKEIFIFHRITAGIQLSSSVRIALNFYKSNGFVNDNFPTTLSVSLVPGK